MISSSALETIEDISIPWPLKAGFVGICFICLVLIYYPSYKKENVSVPYIARSLILQCLVPFSLLFFIFNHVLLPVTVASGSMEPKLKVGNLTFYNGLAYINDVPHRGDIILFKSVELNKDMAKRVIGIPGDHIEFIDGYVFINGLRVDESAYLPTGINTYCEKMFDVPENSVFVLGDFRSFSKDSRFFNQPYIPYNDIEGRYMFQSEFNPKYRIHLFCKKLKE